MARLYMTAEIELLRQAARPAGRRGYSGVKITNNSGQLACIAMDMEDEGLVTAVVVDGGRKLHIVIADDGAAVLESIDARSR